MKQKRVWIYTHLRDEANQSTAETPGVAVVTFFREYGNIRVCTDVGKHSIMPS